MTTSDLTPKNIQNRHILNLLGVSLWVNKQSINNQAICRMPAMVDRFYNPRLAHLLPEMAKKPNDTNELSHQKNNDDYHDNHTSINNPAIHIKESLPKKAHDTHQSHRHSEDNHQNLPLQKTTSFTPQLTPQNEQPNIQFYLQGLRFGHWVIIVDILSMNGEEQALWQSLKNALARELQKQNAYQNINAIYREIHYPLVKNEFRADVVLNPAQHTFDGFIIGFGASVPNQRVQVAFLTHMPQGIIAPTPHHLPTINDMMANPILKKTFWQQVVG